ncbi:MAG: hypothetical protein SRB2_04487 [Desulfobacteraceae bacterium Eth-SRB2]|nr:MAG: hypothetical protein SRB2_04487 [Desulfobacteraceae bacterium Eth-SRB2]
MSRKKVAIHQPDFMPWLGFFKKISVADVFVVLDHTKNNPRDANFWCRRVKLCVQGKEYWFSVTLKKPKGVIGQKINEMEVLKQNPANIKKLMKTIEQSYGKAPFYGDFVDYICEYFDHHSLRLLTRNMKFIERVMEALDLRPEIIYSSTLAPIGSSTEMLVDLVEKVGGGTYISGVGAKNYQDESLFEKKNIHLTYSEFRPTTYTQINSDKFIPGLSVIDALMNIGADETKSIITRT